MRSEVPRDPRAALMGRRRGSVKPVRMSGRALRCVGVVACAVALAGCLGDYDTSQTSAWEVECETDARAPGLVVEGCWDVSSYSGPLGLQTFLTQLLEDELGVEVEVVDTDCPADMVEDGDSVACSFRIEDAGGRNGVIELDGYLALVLDRNHVYDMVVVLESP